MDTTTMATLYLITNNPFRSFRSHIRVNRRDAYRPNNTIASTNRILERHIALVSFSVFEDMYIEYYGDQALIILKYISQSCQLSRKLDPVYLCN